MSIRAIITQAASRFAVPQGELLSPSRRRELAWPRQWVMFEAAAKGYTSRQIAHALSRDHSTILEGIAAERARREGGAS